jgi:hypothetical protein
VGFLSAEYGLFSPFHLHFMCVKVSHGSQLSILISSPNSFNWQQGKTAVKCGREVVIMIWWIISYFSQLWKGSQSNGAFISQTCNMNVIIRLPCLREHCMMEFSLFERIHYFEKIKAGCRLIWENRNCSVEGPLSIENVGLLYVYVIFSQRILGCMLFSLKGSSGVC